MTLAIVSPGQAFAEVDLSFYVPALSTTHAGMVGTASKGPLNTPTLCTSAQDLEDRFGPAHPDHLALYAARLYFSQGRLLTFVRVATTSGTDAAVESEVDLSAAATPAIHKGTARGPFLVTSSNNTLEYDATGTAATITLTTGLRTAQQIVDEFNDDSSFSGDLVALLNSDGTISIRSDSTGTSETFDIEADATSTVNTLLGFTAGTYTGGAASADPSLTVKAVTPGTWGNDLSVGVETGTQSGTFKLNVYSDGLVVEIFDNLSNDEDDDNFHEDVIGLGEGGITQTTTSLFIRTEKGATGYTDDIPTTTSSPLDLIGGLNGDSSISDADIGSDSGNSAIGLQVFRDVNRIGINLLAAPGLTSQAVVNEMVAIAVARGDVFVVVDPPNNLTLQEALDFHNGVSSSSVSAPPAKLNSSFAGIWWPWVQIYDPFGNRNVWTPPSAHVILAMTRTDFNDAEHYAPAGPVRGLLPHAIDLEYNPSQGDRDLMYDTNGTGNALNPIINHPVHGIVIWGQRTTQRTASALDRVNVRRLLLRVRKLASVAASQVTFSPGDLATALSFENRLSPALEDLRQSRGLVDFRIQADETLNTPEVLARNELRARLFVKPTRAVEFFLMTVVLTEQGADFNDLAL